MATAFETFVNTELPLRVVTPSVLTAGNYLRVKTTSTRVIEQRTPDQVLTDLTLARITGSTYSTIQHLQDLFHSAGWVSGGTVTDAGSGTVDVTAGTGLIRATDSRVAEILFFDWPASLAVAIPTNTTRWIGIEYNAGSPQVVVKTSHATFDFQTDFPLAKIVNEAGTLHIQVAQQAVGDHAAQMILRMHGTMPLQRDERLGGLILGETGTRNVTFSAGAMWDDLNYFPIAVINTSGADRFETYYVTAGTWTRTGGVSQWPNAQYNDTTSGLVTMTNNRYANLWFYIEPDGELVMVYGQAQFTNSSQAENEQPPSTIPERVTEHAKFIGRLLFKKSGATATQIDTVFQTVFVPTQASDHNSLGNLTVGDVHTHYALLAGRSGGQTLIGDTVSGGNLVLQSTAHATKGSILLGPAVIDSNAKMTLDAGSGNTVVITPHATRPTIAMLGDTLFDYQPGSSFLALGKPGVTIGFPASAVAAPMSVDTVSTEPSSPFVNDVYLDDGTNTASGNPGWRRYTGTVWEDISAVGGGLALRHRTRRIWFRIGVPTAGDYAIPYVAGFDADGAITDYAQIRRVMAMTRGSGSNCTFNVHVRSDSAPEGGGAKDVDLFSSNLIADTTRFDGGGADNTKGEWGDDNSLWTAANAVIDSGGDNAASECVVVEAVSQSNDPDELFGWIEIRMTS